jgi:hypothetical protein
MGEARVAKCRGCEAEFEVAQGPGMFCHILHCDGCYAVRFVGFDEIEGLLRALEDAGGDAYEADQRALVGAATAAERAYDAAVEAFAGPCAACGGRHRFDAPPCCPRCRGTSIDVGDDVLLFD